MQANDIALFAAAVMFCTNVNAQTATSSKEAEYLATVKAVADFKINDEEELKNIEKLRQNRIFLNKLQKRLEKLSNNKNKNSTNKKVLDILKKAGKDLERVLD